MRAAVCGLPPPLSATLSVPLRVPVAVGLNRMLTVQLAPPAIELPHVFPEIRKSPGLVPAMENPVNVTVDAPALCTVIDLAALVVPTATVPKFSEVGEREIAVPTPLRATVWVAGLASSVKVKLPVRVPMAVGVNVTLTVQLAPTATVLPQVLALMAKSPLMPILLMLSVAVPVFVSFTTFAGLVVPNTLLANVSFATERVTTGPPLLPAQVGNLKLAMRVFQLKLPVVFMYSCVYQKVQSSTGSTVMAL